MASWRAPVRAAQKSQLEFVLDDFIQEAMAFFKKYDQTVNEDYLMIVLDTLRTSIDDFADSSGDSHSSGTGGKLAPDRAYFKRLPRPSYHVYRIAQEASISHYSKPIVL